jgi:ABC-type polysaccharide/polyol phosphate transport system ATPase subunit
MNLHTGFDGMSERLIDNNFVIHLEDVSVSYRVPSERIRTFKEYAIRRIQGKVHHREFLALDRICLEVKPGEVFGVIGNNGAGKSTLLKVVARVIFPTRGKVRVRGRVAPLLELGAGFHPELSGRENIYLNGAILGFSRNEMGRNFQRIVDFAGLGDFIDSPMRTYSSGMWARLGFAVATDERPEILLVDEILAVGDEAFQHKCTQRIQEFRDNGTTILFVAHNMDTIQSMCQRVAWLNHGKVEMIGTPVEVVRAYRESQP